MMCSTEQSRLLVAAVASAMAAKRTSSTSRCPLRRPDWAACQELAAQVVNASATCARPPCALGVPQPSAGAATFYALTGAFCRHGTFRSQLIARLTREQHWTRLVKCSRVLYARSGSKT